jgi:hypothetical protein
MFQLVDDVIGAGGAAVDPPLTGQFQGQSVILIFDQLQCW